MKKFIVPLLALMLGTAMTEAARRDSVLFNFDWRFHLGEFAGGERADTDDSSWKCVDLPKDFQLNMPWNPGAKPSRGFKEMSGAWFRKNFRPDESWKGRRVMLDFEGLMYYGDVYLNGEKIGSTEYGYCGFECDMTDRLRYGDDNLIAVYTHTGPADGSRWYTGGGINRNVHIIVSDTMSMARHGVYVVTEKTDNDEWIVRTQAEVPGNILEKGKVDFKAEIIDADDNCIASTPLTAAPEMSRLHLYEVKLPILTVKSPRVWTVTSPGAPDNLNKLYTCRMTMYVNGKPTDTVDTRFGFRVIDYGPDYGFRLNGEKVFMQGIANHVDFGGVGVAAFPAAIKRQLKTLREFGYNAVRCSHNPYPPVFYDLCDEMGFLVVDEFVDKWSNDGNCWGGRESFMNVWPSLMTEWVKRDRNHPCIVMWSLGNEMQHRENASGYMTGDWGVTTFRILDTFLKRYDSSRPSTAAMYPARANGIRRADPGFREKANIIPPELSRITEVASYNYEYADYPQYKTIDPNLTIFQSEASVNDLVTPWLRMDRESTVGLCYWGAIEYWGESDGWPKKGWNYSFFDHTLLPYPRAWLVRSCFVDEPQVHIGVLDGEQKSIIWNDILSGRAEMSHFYWRPVKGDSITLEVSSNCDEVELFRNGKSLGIKRNNRENDKVQNKFLWRAIEWEPGKVEAVGRNQGREVARHSLNSPGKAVRLAIEDESTGLWKADGMDLRYIRVTAVDAKGNPVDNYEGELTVNVDGEANMLALDNGNHFTDIGFENNSTPLYRGRALIILRSTRNCGSVKVNASVPGIRQAKISLITE
ncbi:MAG: DUF4982 domain-containing protein [Duncaniella sp.]|nr:DUF4982 domain-containing protein [Duncaniella sp.]MDE6858889.1 DUF4982 domain-containing protein [Duncaniella sp.]MDE7144715.1 DUF4982 domain-containing protein [Duncaniella sp.]